MNIEEALKIDITDKNVLIVGYPATGKTHFSNLLNAENHNVLHSDNFKQFGFKESLYELMKSIESSTRKTIVEGIQGYRLLRKGVELNNYYPDIVFEMISKEETIIDRYNKERDTAKIKYIQSTCKSLDTIKNDYRSVYQEKYPKWIIVENDIISE